MRTNAHSLFALPFNFCELVRLESKSVAHTVCGNYQRGIVTVNLNHHLKEPRVTKREASGHTCGGLLGLLQQAKETHFNCGHGHPCGVWCGGPRLEKTEKASYFQASKLTASDCRRDVSSCLRLQPPNLPHHNKLCIIINLSWLQARASSHSNRKKKLILEPSSVRGNKGGLGAKENCIFILASYLRMALENLKSKNRPKPCL